MHYIGFLSALVPPASVVHKPILMKNSLHVTFLRTILHILIRGFLLGPAGAILALSLAVKKYIENPWTEGKPAPELAPG